MAKQPSPDGRLVYLHCSSIFSGANAQVRRPKVIARLLQEQEASIKILTKEFTLQAIAEIAKELLEDQLFESLPRAKLRFPELFQWSGTREDERAASEAEAVRIEAEVAQDPVLTSDDDGGAECLNYEQDECSEPEEIFEDHKEAPENAQVNAAETWQVSYRDRTATSLTFLIAQNRQSQNTRSTLFQGSILSICHSKPNIEF